MSSCIVTGFFNVGPRRRGLRRVPVGAIQPETILFAHYRSSLLGTMQSLGTVFIRPPTPTWHNILTDRAVVFVSGAMFAQTGSRPSLIQASHMSLIHSPQSQHVCTTVFPPCLVTAVGTVASEHHPQFFGRPHHDLTRSLGCSENVLSHVCGVVFPPSLLPADPNLSCLISHHDFVTRYPRLPLVGAFVQIRGYLSRTLPSDAFAVDIVDFNYFFPFGLLPPQPHSAPTLPLDTPCDETVVSRASPNCSL
jgi:hypothetical protein